MVTKPTKEFTDSMGRRKLKGNMDIELAIDVLEMAPHLDHVVLFSGDGDFRRLVEAVQRKGVRVSQHHRSQPHGGRRASPPGRRFHRAGSSPRSASRAPLSRGRPGRPDTDRRNVGVSGQSPGPMCLR
jgi:hypothetical protein